MKTKKYMFAALSVVAFSMTGVFAQTYSNRVGFGVGGEQIDLSNVDFTSSTKVYNSPFSIYASQNGSQYKDLYLQYGVFNRVNVVGANFTGKDLSYAEFAWGSVKGANFSGATIWGTRFAGEGLSYAQLSSTQDFANKSLNLIMDAYPTYSNGTIVFLKYSQANFAGFNLNNSYIERLNLQGANFADVNFNNSSWYIVDFRGAQNLNMADLLNTGGYYLNIIATDGTIMGNHADGDIVIFKNNYNSTEAYLRKDASMQGYNIMIEDCGILNVVSGVTLESNTAIMFTASESGSGVIKVQGDFIIGDSSILVVNVSLDFCPTKDTELLLIAKDGGTISGSFDESNTFVGSSLDGLNSVLYDGEWRIFEDSEGIKIVFSAIPEPGTYAVIFGALALAFASYRRRK